MSSRSRNSITDARGVLIAEANPAITAMYAERLARVGLACCECESPAAIVAGEPLHGLSRDDHIAELARRFPNSPILALVDPSERNVKCVFDAGAAAVLVRCPGYLDQLGVVCLGLIRSASVASLARALDEIKTENETLRGLIERLEAVASTDALTGLTNRRGLECRLSVLFNSAERYGAELSCLVIDVDELKVVNDRLGHAAGDSLLKLLAEALVQACRKSDVAARIGGDEFVVLLPHTPATAAAHLTRRIREHFAVLSREFADRLHDSHIGLSIGVSGSSMPEVSSAEALIAAADAAMYADKLSGRSDAVPRSCRTLTDRTAA